MPGEALPPEIAAKIHDSFARQSMMRSIRAEIVSLAPGKVTLVAPVLEKFRQQQDFGHAGLTFALGDSAAGYSALSVMPPEVDVLTVEMKINLLAPASGHLVAEGRVVKPGKRLVVVAADVWAEDDGKRRQVALLQGTMIPV